MKVGTATVGGHEVRAWVAAIAVSRESAKKGGSDMCLDRYSRPGGASLRGVRGLFSEEKYLDVAIECP